MPIFQYLNCPVQDSSSEIVGFLAPYYTQLRPIIANYTVLIKVWYQWYNSLWCFNLVMVNFETWTSMKMWMKIWKKKIVVKTLSVTLEKSKIKITKHDPSYHPNFISRSSLVPPTPLKKLVRGPWLLLNFKIERSGQILYRNITTSFPGLFPSREKPWERGW